jgi:hypothetical protein
LRNMPSTHTDELEQRTLDTFLAGDKSAGAPPPARGVWRRLRSLFKGPGRS